MSSTRLTIGYSTLGERVHNIEFPPAQADTEILVIVQGKFSSLPAVVEPRSDISVILLDSSGVARSRNAVISSASGRYIAFADDDANPLIDGLAEALDYLDANAEISILAGRSTDFAGHARKRYASSAQELTRWNSAKFGTIEIVARRESVVSSGLCFDEEFGAGTTNYLGDEYIFVTDALKLGLCCRFAPIDLAEHEAKSSGTMFGTPADAAARSAVFGRVFGRAAPIARLAFVIRNFRRFRNPRTAGRFIAGRFARR